MGTASGVSIGASHGPRGRAHSFTAVVPPRTQPAAADGLRLMMAALALSGARPAQARGERAGGAAAGHRPSRGRRGQGRGHMSPPSLDLHHGRPPGLAACELRDMGVREVGVDGFASCRCDRAGGGRQAAALGRPQVVVAQGVCVGLRARCVWTWGAMRRAGLRWGDVPAVWVMVCFQHYGSACTIFWCHA